MHATLRFLLALTSVLIAIVPPTLRADFPAGSNSFFGSPQISVFNDNSLGTNISAFTSEGSEPGHRPGGFDAAQKSAWWRWTAPANGLVTISTINTGTLSAPVQDTVLAIYTGNNLNNLLLVAVNDNHGSYGLHPSHRFSTTTFYALQGTTYNIAVDAYAASDVDANHTSVAISIRLTELKKSIRSAVFAASATAESTGIITVTTTTSTTLSGKCVLGGKTYPFAGTFGTDGYFTTSFQPKPTPTNPQPLPVTVKLDLAGLGKYFVDIGSQANTTYEFPPRITFNQVFPNSTVGTYPATLVTNSPFGAGTGVAAISVKPNGSVTGVCIGIDGLKYTFSSALQQTGIPGTTYHFPVYSPLYQNRGCFAMNGFLAEKPTGDEILGNALLIRPAPTSGNLAFYPAGIFQPLILKGTSYTKPTVGPVLDFLNPTYTGQLEITNANAELLGGNLNENLSFSANNKFIFTSATNKPVLTLNTTTGLITGSITEPGGKKRTLNAVLTKIEGTPTLAGHLVGTTRTLSLTVTP